MNQRSLPLTHMISLGNQASLKNTDFINYLIDKKEVRAFGLHIESIENISDFEVAAKKAIEAQKPIVVLKTGKSKIGATLTKSMNINADYLSSTTQLIATAALGAWPRRVIWCPAAERITTRETPLASNGSELPRDTERRARDSVSCHHSIAGLAATK